MVESGLDWGVGKDPFDPEYLRVDPAEVERLLALARSKQVHKAMGASRPHPPKSSRAFVPSAPVDWYEAIYAVQKAPVWIVAQTILRLTAMRKSLTVKLTNQELTPLGITRAMKAHALKLLEAAGFILVQRRTGSSPTVTLLRDPWSKS
jgi:hypothetical protein